MNFFLFGQDINLYSLKLYVKHNKLIKYKLPIKEKNNMINTAAVSQIKKKKNYNSIQPEAI